MCNVESYNGGPTVTLKATRTETPSADATYTYYDYGLADDDDFELIGIETICRETSYYNQSGSSDIREYESGASAENGIVTLSELYIDYSDTPAWNGWYKIEVIRAVAYFSRRHTGTNKIRCLSSGAIELSGDYPAYDADRWVRDPVPDLM